MYLFSDGSAADIAMTFLNEFVEKKKLCEFVPPGHEHNAYTLAAVGQPSQ